MSCYLKTALICLFLVIWFCLFQEINTDDETWFLQVVDRVLSGEVIYKDIFFNTTPLSIYIPVFFCKIFGSELLVLRIIHAFYFLGMVFFSYKILKELQAPPKSLLLFSLLFFVFAHPQSTWGFSGYNALAIFFFLGCFYFAVRWVNYFSLKDLVLAAITSGLCFSAKHNIGAIAFICLCIVVGFKNKKIKNFLFLCSFFSLFVFLCLAPTFLQNGWKEFLDYALWNKGRYLKSSHVNYFLISSSWNLFTLFIFIAPFLLLFLVVKFYKQKGIGPLVLWVFFIGAFLTLYPRPDNPQKMICIPIFLIALRYFLQVKKQFHLNALVFIALCFSLLSSSKDLFFGKKRLSSVSHFKWLVMDKQCHEHWKNMQKKFAQNNAVRNCFFLSTHAGFYYLLFDLKNPTPFDLPVHPALGLSGEEAILNKIRTHKISRVFIDHPKWTNWYAMRQDRRPYQIEAFIEETMQESSVFLDDFFVTIFLIFQNNS